MGSGDGTGNRRLLLLGAVLNTLAGKIGGTTLACLKANHQQSVNMRSATTTDGRTGDVAHDRGLRITSSLEGGDHSAAGGDIRGRNGKALLAGVGEELQHILACLTVNIYSSYLRCRRGRFVP